MGFFERLDNLRSKPESARRNIVVLSSLSITALILIGWIMYFTNSVPGILAEGDDPRDIVAPFSYLKGQIVDVAETFGEGVSVVRESQRALEEAQLAEQRKNSELEQAQ